MSFETRNVHGINMQFNIRSIREVRVFERGPQHADYQLFVPSKSQQRTKRTENLQ